MQNGGSHSYSKVKRKFLKDKKPRKPNFSMGNTRPKKITKIMALYGKDIVTLRIEQTKGIYRPRDEDYSNYI